jgi:hypothetical protein
MNNDALAAVIAAANVLLMPTQAESEQAVVSSSPRWPLAARVRTADAGHARRFARASSRWSHSGRML